MGHCSPVGCPSPSGRGPVAACPGNTGHNSALHTTATPHPACDPDDAAIALALNTPDPPAMNASPHAPSVVVVEDPGTTEQLSAVAHAIRDHITVLANAMELIRLGHEPAP